LWLNFNSLMIETHSRHENCHLSGTFESQNVGILFAGDNLSS